jgi:hypothetical protein
VLRYAQGVKFPYEEFDLSAIHTYPLGSRKSKANATDFARPYRAGGGIPALLESLPLTSSQSSLPSARRAITIAESSGASARMSSKPGSDRS